MKKFIFLMCIIFIMIVTGACSDESASSNKGSDSNKVENKVKLNEGDYEKLYSDPKKYKGYEVELTGQIFNEPEKDEDGTYIQIWGDPENAEKNTIVAIKDPQLDVKTDDYVKVTGVVEDEFEGENGFGATIVAPMILAENVEVVDYITAVAPTLKEISVNKEINQHNVVVTLEKIELAKNQTRVYVKVNNNTKDNASFYSSSTKLIVGSKQLEEEYMDSETTGLPSIQSELLPEIETEGVIVYPAIDMNEKSIKLNAEASTDNYEIDFKPYVFDITIN